MKLHRGKLIEELKLLAAGANGGEVSITKRRGIVAALRIPSMHSFRSAVVRRYFHAEWRRCETPRSIGAIGKEWKTFETLADAVIAERKRLDAVKKQETAQ